MSEDRKVDIREFRDIVGKEHGAQAVDRKAMENFEVYRREKYKKGNTSRDSIKDMKMQFGEMKLNMASRNRSR
jgi:hypothetical protein